MLIIRLGNKIASRRKELGLTQQELADRLYVSVKTISKWETNRGNPEIDILPSLAKALQMDIADLFSSNNASKNEEGSNGDDIEDNQSYYNDYIPPQENYINRRYYQNSIWSTRGTIFLWPFHINKNYNRY